jgi:hypothetical protein
LLECDFAAMSKLLPLTQQLQSLRNARASVRQQSAWATVGTAILVALLVLFAVDWFFQREVGPIQRIVLMVVGVGGIVWAFKTYAWPLLRVREDATDMALLVERKQALDSDLVAAIQFEKDREGKWGSKILEDAVVDYIARVSPELNVFEGFSRGDLPRRAMLLGAVAAIILVVAAIFPQHVWTFIQRLALGNPHYPSTIAIDALVLNEHAVVQNAASGENPAPVVCVEAQPIRFLAVCRGTEAPEATMKLDAVDFRGSSEVTLKRLTDDERQRLLQEAKNELKAADEGRSSRTKLAARLWCDAPRAADALLEASSDDVALAMTEIDRAITNWPQGKREGIIYVGELPRLTNDIRYQLELDGAWTEPGLVRMSHLPQVEPVLTISPPSYVGNENREQVGGRQTAVLEGSKVEFALESKNQRPLRRAWVVLTSGQTSQKVDLVSVEKGTDSKGALKWELPLEASPLASVRSDWRFEGFAEDVDGLMPEAPIRGSIRIRPDGQAILSLATIHKVVLPTASPVLEYKATDDFGLKRLRLVAQVLPAEAAESTESEAPKSSVVEDASDKGAPGNDELPTALDVDLLEGGEPLLAKRLPATGKHSLNMASIKAPGRTAAIGKGDRVRIVLEAEDWRGDAAGKIVRSEPITLEISDEAGVLAAISEADQRSEERLTDIIKRQLGIGENP